MDNLVTIIVSVVGAITTIVGFLTSFLSKRTIKTLKNNATLRERLLLAMVEAEQEYDAYKTKLGIDVGTKKKNYVLNDLRTYALQNNISFDEEAYTKEIERMIDFSNNVNA